MIRTLELVQCANVVNLLDEARDQVLFRGRVPGLVGMGIVSIALCGSGSAFSEFAGGSEKAVAVLGGLHPCW
jgi:hypothetical protein